MPPQDALEAHFRQVADGSGLPVMLYDIPGRTGTRIEPETLIRLAGHPRIVAVKDCSYDFLAAQKVIARTGLAYYAGCDEHNLALYAVGGAGYVSTVANVIPAQLRAVLDLFDAGDTGAAAALQQRATDLIESLMSSGLPGTVTTKALLTSQHLPSGPVRPPLLPVDHATTEQLRAAYEHFVTTTAAGRPDTEAPFHARAEGRSGQ